MATFVACKWSVGCGTFDALDGAVAIEDPDMVALLLRYGARPKESTLLSTWLRLPLECLNFQQLIRCPVETIAREHPCAPA